MSPLPSPRRSLSLPALALLLLLAAGCGDGTSGEVARPDPDAIAYVGGEACADCHAEEAAAWKGSDHDLAMQHATAETVLGDFEDATYTHFGVTTRFFQRGDSFFVHTEGPTGAMETFPIKYTFGYAPLQQYLIEFPDGRLQALSTAWDTEGERWFSLQADERVPHDDWLHWTKPAMNWNYMCADCHSTNLRKNYDVATNTYATEFSEIDVSCEACHGPGQAHVEWARTASTGDDASAGDDDYAGDVGLTVALQAPADSRRQVETCAPCHSRRRVLDPAFTPGEEYLDHYEPELLDEGLYFADGQIQDEVYVYGSFVQSKMYHNGVRCSDCHDPHTTRLKLEGNALCGQCHVPTTYDTPEHHHHAEETAGANCVDCHMPERTYMVVDPRRDHSFKVPRPDLTVDLGTPNACNGCHTDRSPEWARDRVVEWFGPDRADEPHPARAIAAGREGAPEAEPFLATLAADADRPAILRATALRLLGRYGSTRATDVSADALDDPEPIVRLTAVRNLETLPPEQVDRLVARLVEDSIRAVRAEAARVLAQTGRYTLAETPQVDGSQAFLRALGEYRATQEALSDQPAAHLNMGVLHEQSGAASEAERAYRLALRIDSSFVPAHLNLAMLYSRQAGAGSAGARLREAAERHLRDAIALSPEMAEAHYSLGLLLAESPERMPEAADYLARAAALAPQDARIQYNAGLAHQHLGRDAEAERLLLAAHEAAPEHPDYLNALSIFYVQRQRWDDALRFTRLLSQRAPGSPEIQQRLAYIDAQN